MGVEWARAARVRFGRMRGWGDVGILLVRFTQQALQAEQYARHVVYGAPLVLEDVETDAAGEVDVRVVDGCFEEDGWRRVRVIVRELEGELESQAFVGSFGWAGDGSCPGEEVAVCVGEGGDAGRGREHELHELSLQAGESIRSIVMVGVGERDEPLGHALSVISLGDLLGLDGLLCVLHVVVHCLGVSRGFLR